MFVKGIFDTAKPHGNFVCHVHSAYNVSLIPLKCIVTLCVVSIVLTVYL